MTGRVVCNCGSCCCCWMMVDWIWPRRSIPQQRTETTVHREWDEWLAAALNCGQQFGSYLSPLSVCKTDRINSSDIGAEGGGGGVAVQPCPSSVARSLCCCCSRGQYYIITMMRVARSSLSVITCCTREGQRIRLDRIRRQCISGNGYSILPKSHPRDSRIISHIIRGPQLTVPRIEFNLTILIGISYLHANLVNPSNLNDRRRKIEEIAIRGI